MQRVMLTVGRLWQQFGEGPFHSAWHDNELTITKPIETYFSQFSVEELYRTPDRNLIQHLWDELEP